MSQGRPEDPLNPVVGLTGDDEQNPESSLARAHRVQHRAQREHLNTSLEEMQSDLQHFSSTVQRLQDHFRATPQTDIPLTRTLESSQAMLETVYNHLFALRNTLRTLSPPQSPTPAPPAPPSLFPETRTILSSTNHSSRTSAATNGWEETISPLTAETSPAEERTAHYLALASFNRSMSSGVWVHHNARRRQAPDGEGLSSEVEVRRQSEALDDAFWYSMPPSLPSSDRPQPARPPRLNLGWTPRPRLPPTQLDSTTTQQIPSSVVQFSRQSQPSAPSISSTSSSSFASSTDPNTPNSGGDGGSAGNDEITSVNRAANRLFHRLSTLQETTRRLREARERRWSNLPDRGLAEGQTPTTGADFDPSDPTAPARRPDVYANLLRRRVLSTAPPPNVGVDASGEEENKENVERESTLCHIVWGEG